MGEARLAESVTARIGLTPASDDELTTQDQPPTPSTSCLLGARKRFNDGVSGTHRLPEWLEDPYRGRGFSPWLDHDSSPILRTLGEFGSFVGPEHLLRCAGLGTSARPDRAVRVCVSESAGVD